MYSYLIGTVVEMNIDHIVVENSGIGYLIYVNNPYEYTRGKEIKIFLYLVHLVRKNLQNLCLQQYFLLMTKIL